MVDIQSVYNVLLTNITKTPSEYVLTTNICSIINKLELDYANFLLGIIYHYYVTENNRRNVVETDLVKNVTKKSSILTVPYGGKTYDNGKAPKFENLTKFPLKLKQLIVAYIKYIQ